MLYGQFASCPYGNFYFGGFTPTLRLRKASSREDVQKTQKDKQRTIADKNKQRIVIGSFGKVGQHPPYYQGKEKQVAAKMHKKRRKINNEQLLTKTNNGLLMEASGRWVSTHPTTYYHNRL
jgi:hypothetical protein